MELFKGSLHYRCALPGYQESPRQLSLSNVTHDYALESLPFDQQRRTPSRVVLRLDALGAVLLARAPDIEQSSVHFLGRQLDGAASNESGSFQESGHMGGSAGSTNEEYDDKGDDVDDESFDTGTFCNMNGDACAAEDGLRCAYFEENPSDGAMSFDSVPYAALALLQTLTFDTWTDAMFALMQVGIVADHAHDTERACERESHCPRVAAAFARGYASALANFHLLLRRHRLRSPSSTSCPSQPLPGFLLSTCSSL